MKTTLKRAVASTALTLISAAALSQPAFAGSWELFQGAPKFKDANGNTLKVRGRILFDLASIDETRKSGTASDADDSEFRAARLGFEGQYDSMKFKFEMDFEGSDATVKDAFVNFTKVGGSAFDIGVGQMKTPTTMHETASSRHITFMERAAYTDAFGLDRRVGVQLTHKGKQHIFEAGAFRNSINGMQDDQDENTVYAARVGYAPVMEKDNLIHLGATVRYTDEDNSGSPGRSSRWGAHLATEKVKPKIGEEATLWGIEAATVQGAFHAQAEYMTEDGSLGDADGYMVSAGYFLTGENRGYKIGKFDRTKPKNPISKGGFGAWEIATRYDTIDATNAGDEESSAVTVGLIWYPESHLRFKLEAIEANADTYDASGVQFRTQIDW